MRLLLYPAARTDHLRRIGERILSLSPQSQPTAADQDWDATEQQLLLDLGGYKLLQRRADVICEANMREQEGYLQQQQQLEADIQQAHRDIAQAKQDLAAAKVIRGQNEEYEALRRLIMEHPKRSELRTMSEELDEEIAATGADDKAAEHTKQWRRKQFTVLMHHIRDMQKSMEDESDEVG